MEPIYFLVIASYFVVFSMGFIIARLSGTAVTNSIPQIQHENPISQTTKAVIEEKKANKKIEIDEKKFITEIQTDTLEKKFNDLGKKTVAQDESLGANVSKLASLKKNKEG